MAGACRPRWLARLRQLGLLAAAVACVAGCVNMPDNGPVIDVTAPSQTAAPQGLTGVFPSAPMPDGTPSQIVQGFLAAAGSYPSYSPVAKEYLSGPAAARWSPDSVTVLGNLNVAGPEPAPRAYGRHAAKRASVTVTGSVQATFTGTGQYVSAQGQDQPADALTFTFKLVPVNGQWRITNPPPYRLLNAGDVLYYYKVQDLYFFDKAGQVLVPDSVLVPLGASAPQLVISLVSALAQDPQQPWLDAAAVTAFPARTQVLAAPLVEGATATVNLGGAVTPRTPAATLEQIAAQLVWTLTGSSASPSSIQSVVLEIDGHPWTPSTPPCPGDRTLSSYQTQATYECYNPYRPDSASFYYIDRGQLWSRCGAEAEAGHGAVGAVVPVIARTGVFNGQGCGSASFVQAPSVVQLPSQSRSLGALSMVAVSPDGKYLAVVPPGRDAVYTGPLSGDAASFLGPPRLTGSGITALSWDRDDDLWVAQGGNIHVLPPSGKQILVEFSGPDVTGLSVAPDGVRIALIESDGSRSELQLAAITRINQSESQLSKILQPTVRIDVDAGPVLGPSITRPTALTWYGADDLVVLDGAGAASALWEVPVDGQLAQEQFTPPGTIWISADGPANALVAGLTGDNIAVSTSPEGPWQSLGNQGQDPVYPG